MTSGTNQPASSSNTSARAISRRAVIGLCVLGLMSGGSAALLYATIEPDAEFSDDPDGERRKAMLGGVKSWASGGDRDGVEALLQNSAALLVVAADGLAALKVTALEQLISRLQAQADGGRRLVLASLRIEQSNGRPVLNSANATIDALLASGIDGVVLECQPMLLQARDTGRAASDFFGVQIIEFAQRLRQVNPNFLVLLGNGAELVVDARVNRVIDGVTKDNLLFGLDGAGISNSRTDVIAGLHDLNRAKRLGRAVFVTEYLELTSAEVRAGASQMLATLGFVGQFASVKPPL